MTPCERCGFPLEDNTQQCPNCGCQRENYFQMCYPVQKKPHWYAKLFDTYLRFLFIRVSVGSIFIFLTVFMASTVLCVLLSEITGWTNLFDIALYAVPVLAFIVTVIVTKRIQKN